MTVSLRHQHIYIIVFLAMTSLAQGCSTSYKATPSSKTSNATSTNQNKTVVIPTKSVNYPDVDKLTPDNLAGEWVPIQLYMQKRGLNRSLKRNLPSVTYHLEYSSPERYKAYSINRKDSVKSEPFDLMIRTNRYGMSLKLCLLYTSPSPRDKRQSRMPSSA